jgi:hypothetical protein
MADLSKIMADLLDGLTFFRQEREDGGVRTGIMLGMATVFERFEIDGEEFDPSLIWSVDLRCSGSGLPRAANEAREWLLAHETVVRDGFLRYADQLHAGVDPTGISLLEWSDFQDLPPDISMKIVCGAQRRIDALYLASRVEFVGEHWVELIRGLESSLHEAY